MIESLLKTLIEANTGTQILIVASLVIVAVYAFFNFLRGRAKVDLQKAETEKITAQHLKEIELLRTQSDQATANGFREVLTQMASVISRQLDVQHTFTGEVKNIRSVIDSVTTVLGGANIVTAENTKSLKLLNESVQTMISDANASRERVRQEMIDKTDKQTTMISTLSGHIEHTMTPTLNSLVTGLADIRKNVIDIIATLKVIDENNGKVSSGLSEILNRLLIQIQAVDQSVKVIDTSVKIINKDFHDAREAQQLAHKETTSDNKGITSDNKGPVKPEVKAP